MIIRIGSYQIKLEILLIALAYFFTLFNPWGWAMLLFVAPLYIPACIICLSKGVYKEFRKVYSWMVLFCIFCVISYVLISNAPGASGKVIRHFYELMVIICIGGYLYTEHDIHQLANAYLLSGCLIAIKMLIDRSHILTDANRFTINNFGNLMDPNYLAGVLIFPLLYACYLFAHNHYRLKYFIVVFLLAAAVLATGSRGAFVAILLGILVLYISDNENVSKVLIVGLILAIVAVLGTQFLPSYVVSRFDYRNFNDASNDLRFNLWNAGIKIFLSSPLLGRGGNSMINLGMSYGARIKLMVHNTYISLLSDYGIIGFITFFIPYIVAVVKTWKNKLAFCFSLLLATLMCALFINAEDSAFYWQNLLFSFACINLKENKEMVQQDGT